MSPEAAIGIGLGVGGALISIAIVYLRLFLKVEITAMRDQILDAVASRHPSHENVGRDVFELSARIQRIEDHVGIEYTPVRDAPRQPTPIPRKPTGRG